MIRIVTETGSTNADLVAALRGGEALAEGDWIVANRQSAGRGRQGRKWFDGRGNFMGSTIVRPGHGDPAPASLALVAGLAVYEAVRSFVAGQADLQLKWPNDLMLGGAKVAGILLEGQGEAVVVGIGVNLAAKPDLPDRPTASLADHASPPHRDEFAAALTTTFDREVERWRSYGLEPLVRRWEAAAHDKGTPLTVLPPGEAPLSGRFGGLLADGALLLCLADGGTRAIHAGDVMLADQEG